MTTNTTLRAALEAARAWIVDHRPALTLSRDKTVQAYMDTLAAVDAAALALTQHDDEPVAWAAFAENGNIRIWTSDPAQVGTLAVSVGAYLHPLYTRPAETAGAVDAPQVTPKHIEEIKDILLWPVTEDDARVARDMLQSLHFDLSMALATPPSEKASAESAEKLPERCDDCGGIFHQSCYCAQPAADHAKPESISDIVKRTGSMLSTANELDRQARLTPKVPSLADHAKRADDLVRAALIEEVDELGRQAGDALDGARYRWMRDNKFNAFYLDRNSETSTNYRTALDWIEDSPEDFRDCDPADIQAMKDTDTIWHVHIYPDTPIGSYSWYGSTLDIAIDEAMEHFDAARASAAKEG